LINVHFRSLSGEPVQRQEVNSLHPSKQNRTESNQPKILAAGLKLRQTKQGVAGPSGPYQTGVLVMVCSLAGPAQTRLTGQSISSSIRSRYFLAFNGSSS